MIVFAGFEDLPSLTAEDSITLSIVSSYLDFKVSKDVLRFCKEVSRFKYIIPNDVSFVS